MKLYSMDDGITLIWSTDRATAIEVYFELYDLEDSDDVGVEELYDEIIHYFQNKETGDVDWSLNSFSSKLINSLTIEKFQNKILGSIGKV